MVTVLPGPDCWNCAGADFTNRKRLLKDIEHSVPRQEEVQDGQGSGVAETESEYKLHRRCLMKTEKIELSHYSTIYLTLKAKN